MKQQLGSEFAASHSPVLSSLNVLRIDRSSCSSAEAEEKVVPMVRRKGSRRWLVSVNDEARNPTDASATSTRGMPMSTVLEKKQDNRLSASPA
jgi:hypothetical protein